tara:strand:+ start:176 stop:1108 length:933 start_codon:yes stop_codon:yes gene_type:complete
MSIKAKNFSDLPIWLQEKINIRYDNYDISGEEGYNSHFPEEAKKLPSEEMGEWFASKDISHIQAQSTNPEKANDINNMVLEDSSTNRARGAETMTDDEIQNAEKDNVSDAQELEEELSTFESLSDTEGIEEMIGLTTAGVLLFSGKELLDAIRNKEIKLNEAPKEIVYILGKKSFKTMIIGTCLASGSPLVVTSALGIFVVRNKKLISKIFSVAWGVISHDDTKKVAKSFVKSTVIVTIGTAVLTGELLKSTARGIVKIATHEKTKNITNKTAQVTATTLLVSTILTGKVIKGTAKGLYKFGKRLINRKK